jgi:hypothetical protein
MEREHRDLDGERDEEGEEQQRGVGGAVSGVGEDLGGGLIELRNRERIGAGEAVMVEIEEQDAEQHQHRASQGVEEELDGGVEFARTSPDADEQVHRDKHGFPEDEEEKEVESHENAEHARLQDEEPHVVFLHAVLDRVPGREDRDPAEQRGEHDQQEGDAVDAEVVASADGRDPVAGRALHELEGLTVEALRPEHGHQRQRDEEAGQGEEVGDPADRGLVLLGDEQEKDGAHQRREEDDGEDVVLHRKQFSVASFQYSG